MSGGTTTGVVEALATPLKGAAGGTAATPLAGAFPLLATVVDCAPDEATGVFLVGVEPFAPTFFFPPKESVSFGGALGFDDPDTVPDADDAVLGSSFPREGPDKVSFSFGGGLGGCLGGSLGGCPAFPPTAGSDFFSDFLSDFFSLGRAPAAEDRGIRTSGIPDFF